MSMLHRFQFQYGTIKTYDHFRDKGGKVFQFQYGTIKTLALTLYTMMRNYFNSNMVQLKPINGKFTVVSETDFNSMMVQLKQIQPQKVYTLSFISIP